MTTLASARERNHSRLRHSSRNLPLKLSATPFCQGLPGSINAVPIPCATIQDRSALDTNSGPLSLRRKLGAPRWLTRRDILSLIDAHGPNCKVVDLLSAITTDCAKNRANNRSTRISDQREVRCPDLAVFQLVAAYASLIGFWDRMAYAIALRKDYDVACE